MKVTWNWMKFKDYWKSSVVSCTLVGSQNNCSLLLTIIYGFFTLFDMLDRQFLQSNSSNYKYCLASSGFKLDKYPELTLPEVASVSLVATYRDGVIVNLPWNLLVEGDIIIIGPSRIAPARCKQVGLNSSSFSSIFLWDFLFY